MEVVAGRSRLPAFDSSESYRKEALFGQILEKEGGKLRNGQKRPPYYLAQFMAVQSHASIRRSREATLK